VGLPDQIAAELLGWLPPTTAAVAVHRDAITVVGADPSPPLVAADGAAAVAALDRLAPGFWAGYLAFELGHAIERVVPRGASREPAAVPDGVLARFDARAVIGPDGTITVAGDGPGRAALEDAAARVARGSVREVRDAGDTEPPEEGWWSSLGRNAFAERVGSVLELLRAGECYQVNLTRRLVHDDAMDAVALFRALADRHDAPHLAFWRAQLGGEMLTVVSASPERFLRITADRVETRPVKGTGADPAALAASVKDRAENVMIVDLARNDLGRVCVPGSVTVPALCAVEAHPGLHHLVSTVRGQLRPGTGLGAVVAATFPPASVTGAPKPRVLQAVEDLEPVRRGVYCGAVGWIDTTRPDHLDADLAVAIRTFTITDCTQFGVGGGIVADSDPLAEWAETELKSARLLDLARAASGGLVRA
jgi:para-aminobenzoate synthetase component 1